LPCPGYKKEIKWSLRHEKLLRREQPKACAVRSVGSPAHVLFEECANAIHHHNTDKPTASLDQSEVTASRGISVQLEVSHDVIDEEALRNYLMRCGQVSSEHLTWAQQDGVGIPPTTDDLGRFDLRDTDGPRVQQDNPDVVNTNGDLTVTRKDHAGGGMQIFDWIESGDAQGFIVDDDDDDDEHTAVQQSLSTWRKDVSTAPTLNRSLVDVTTFLIDYWFRDVCPLWSAYDSNLNPNRVLMSRIWTNSQAVLYSMKTMAATCLLPTLPHLKSEANSSARSAVEAIEQDLENLHLSRRNSRTTVPLDLFLALLCVGTTMCWLDTNLLGLAFWKEARQLRDYYHDIYWFLDEEEQQKLTFFENSCVYWDMLAAVVSNETLDDSTMEDTLFGCQPPSSLIKPHPWTGVAYKQQRLLSRTIALCRRHRLRIRTQSKSGSRDPCPAAEDMMDAYLISNQLENMDVPLPQSILDTGDRTSLQIHFAQLANAFRIASLLQLHQTFQLDTSLYPEPTCQKRFVLKLALELVKILEDIPVWSNTRCTQPILYITAASGLRFESQPGQDMFSTLTTEVLEVHHARKFILDRFANLQRSLPPKPIIVATELVQTMWRRYEEESHDALDVHWIDVMIDAKLSTLFG
jgi:hypothetical protein